MRRSMDWTLEDNMVNVCSSAPHSQVAEQAISHLYKQERKRPTPVRRRLSLAVLGRVIPRGLLPVSGMKSESAVSCRVLHPLRIPLVIRPVRRTYVVVRQLMSCCAAGKTGCLDVRRRAFALDGQVRAEWSRYPDSMARRPRDNVAPLQRSSAGWMPARIGRLSADVGCRHPVTICKVSLMAGPIRRV